MNRPDDPDAVVRDLLRQPRPAIRSMAASMMRSGDAAPAVRAALAGSAAARSVLRFVFAFFAMAALSVQTQGERTRCQTVPVGFGGSAMSAASPPVSFSRSCGVRPNTAFGVPAAAQIRSNCSRSRSISLRTACT